MAQELSLKDFSQSALQGRAIGNRAVLPGTYTFSEDSPVKWEETQIGDSSRTLISIQLLSNEGVWVDLGALLKRTKGKDGSLIYINEWVCQYPTTKELATALMSNALIVTTQQKTVWSNWRNGEMLSEPIATSVAWAAQLAPVPSAKAPTSSKKGKR